MKRLLILLVIALAGCAKPAPPTVPAAPAPQSTVPAPPAQAPVPTPPPAAPTVTRAGIWVDSEGTEPGNLLATLADRGITDIYLRMPSLKADGTMALPDAGRVDRLTALAHAKGLRLWAWVPGIRTGLQLGEADVVRRIAENAAHLTGLGFDGVQYDIEPVADGDKEYLGLLEQTRRSLQRRKLLGAATHLIRPEPARAEWSPDYYAQVAQRLDQVAVMAYDTYAASAADFQRYVAYQARTALMRSPENVEVLIGVPAYEDRTERHTPEREPLTAGLAGVREGWADVSLQGRVTGWALFASYTMDAEDWRIWAQR